MTVVWWIVGTVAVLTAVALLLPIELRIRRQEEGWRIFAKIGWHTMPIYSPKNGKKPSKSEAKDRNAKDHEKKSLRRQKKANRRQIYHLIKTLPPIIGKALGRTGQRICVCPLQLHLLIADENPADAAVLYGKLQAIFASVMPLAHQKLHIEEQDIQLFLDFQQEQTHIRCDIGLRLRPWDGIAVGVGILPELMTLYRDYQALATLEQTEETVANRTGGKNLKGAKEHGKEKSVK